MKWNNSIFIANSFCTCLNGYAFRRPCQCQHHSQTRAQLSETVNDIDGLDWYAAKEEGLGELYEGLLEKNASENRVRVNTSPPSPYRFHGEPHKPKAGEIIQDPACGTGGFIRSADAYIKVKR